MTYEQELEAAIKKLNGIGLALKDRKKLLAKSAKILQKEIRSNIKDSDEPHFRYATPKVSSKLKAPKGEGNKVATYYPGNLRRSIQVLRFRKSPDVFVGHRKKNGQGAKGEFKGSRVDGFYLWFLEFGTKFFAAKKYVKNAYNAKKVTVAKDIIDRVAVELNNYINRNKIT